MNADVHALAGAYALNALPASERALFRAHLQECSACQQEIDEFTVTAARLGSSASEAPPVELKARVMSEVSRTRQRPPLTDPDPVASVSFLRRRGTTLVAAAAAVVLIAAGIGGLRAWTGDPSKQEVIAAVVAARDAHTDRVDLDGGGSMTLISSADQGRVVVLAEALPDPGPGEVYQLWLLDEEGAEPTQAFFTGSGQGQVHLMEDMPADAQVAVTREPDGGSQTPSMDPLGVVSAVAT